AAFNMVPGFPLDGGRVLRAAIWWLSRDREKSETIAAKTGQAMAILFIIAGIAVFMLTGAFNGLWLAFIGWFLITAAQGYLLQVSLRESLGNLRAADAMSRSWHSVPSDLKLDQFVENEVSRSWRRCFLVHIPSASERIIGLITPHDVSSVKREEWHSTTVADVMRPMDSTKTAAPDTPIISALETMSRHDINQMPVVKNDHVVGLLTRANIVQLFQNRAELGVRSA